jgi:hypothetical protein
MPVEQRQPRIHVVHGEVGFERSLLQLEHGSVQSRRLPPA